MLTWDFRLLREEVSVVALISRDRAPRVEEKGINRIGLIRYLITEGRKIEGKEGWLGGEVAGERRTTDRFHCTW